MATSKCTHMALTLVNFEDRFAFTCNGCRELGYGSCYTCHPQCNYHLHKDCHLTRSTISHPFFTQGQFVLKQVDNKNAPHSMLCDACGMSVTGWRYTMTIDRSFEISLHPCCTTLPHANAVKGESFILTKKLESLNLCCAHCRQGSGVTGWAYVLARCNVAFHVKCIKEMHHQNWERNYYWPNHLNNNNNDFRGVNQDRGLNRRFRKCDLVLGAANVALYALGLGGTGDMMVMMVELASNIWGSI